MICPRCQHPKTSVTNSRPRLKEASTWRRRQCSKCALIFTSEERPALDYAVQVSTGNQTKPFSVGQLTLSIAKAFVHNPEKGTDSAYELARSVEQQLAMLEEPLTADLIRLTTANALERYDKLAATVYAAQHGVELA